MTAAPTILVVEDNPSTLKVLRLTLEKEGYAIVEAHDARTALEAAQRKLPDLVLQDLLLPDMDGLELVQRLRALAGTELPILALSGMLGRLEASRTADAGFTTLLMKPIEPSRLVESIRAYLPPRYEPSDRVLHGGQRLLVVDDDAVQLKLTRIHFSHLGFDVITAAGAADALRVARTKPPDVVLSDVFMPETDGFQLCLELRRDPTLARVPVVLMSSRYGSEADRELARRVGASALVLRTPDFGEAVAAIGAARRSGAAAVAEEPSDQLKLRHATLVIQQLERQVAATSGLAQRCALQATQLSLLSGIAQALTRHTDIDAALRDVLAVTLDAAGISKGALLLRDSDGVLRLRQDVGFSDLERGRLEVFFGHLDLLEAIVARGRAVPIPSPALSQQAAGAILAGANVASAQVVPLISDGRGVGAMIIGATRTDVTSDDSVAFAQAMGNQVVQSLELTRLVGRLSASEQRYRTLLESASDAIAVLTPAGVVRELNHRWLEILGRPYEQLVGRHIRELVPAVREHEPVTRHDAAFPINSDRTTPIEVARPDGSIVLIEFSSTTIDLGGERLVLTIGRDVTQQRRLEDQLRQAQKLEAIGQLAGGVAHDFNNVLTAILGFCELLMGELDPTAPQQSSLVEIQRAAQRASALTGQLLAFGRRQILQPKILAVNDLISDVLPMLRRLIFEHINIVVSATPNVGLIRIDPTQLEQILVNLTVNASDAMPRGGKLTIETAQATIDDEASQQDLLIAPGEYVVLAVSDTGMGMDAATSQRIFDPFFTTKGLGKGTGLGLATVYGIVKQSGGYISVDSEIGRGSTFKIYLPRFRGEASNVVERPTTSADAPEGSETVLVVEDEESVRTLVRATLERGGYRVLPASNPREAVGVASGFRGPIHLLLSDVIMPESEGPPLFDRLTKERPGLRVLYMSGYANESIVHRGLLIEGTSFLQKPFTPQTLRRKVREVLDGPAVGTNPT
jgi:PAS domain S-box-containing protein